MDKIFLSAELGQEVKIRIPCDAPAPIVANGCYYVGCALEKDHGGEFHQVVLKWRT